MGVDIFSINLDKPSRQFSPGENVSGKVFIKISGEETTQEITIRFFGSADTHWVERETHHHTAHDHGALSHHGSHHGGFSHSSHHGIHSSHHSHSHPTSHTEHHSYYGHETLFDFAVRLYGDGENRWTIPVGDSVFPFVFQVPLKPLPVTCSFENGHVVYGLEGRIKKPWYSSDPKTDVLPVTLFKMVDLNITPGAGNPMQVADSKTFGCCCCTTQPCTIQSFTPRLGFCTGEVVPFIVEFQNQSDRSIISITATLTQVWTLFARGYRGLRFRTHPIALEAAGHNGVGPGESTKWEISFVIPPTVPPTPNPAASEIVKMEYVINVNAVVDGGCCNSNFGLSHPIIVGNIPLKAPLVIVPQPPPSTEK